MARPYLLAVRVVLFAACLSGVPADSLAAAPEPGWSRLLIPATGSSFWRYVPASLDPSRPAPVVLFLHGAGGRPEHYLTYITAAAERAGCVLVVPRSSSALGWGFGDDRLRLEESLRRTREALPIDGRRIAVAGHSAGGAYAYLLAYTTRSGYSAVFTMAASRYAVDAVADPLYKAPIRMYYGTLDPNYSNGAYTGLKSQWQRLGVPWEEDVRAGYDHSQLPAAAVEAGFLFLVGRSYPGEASGTCVAAPDRLCLHGGRFQVEVSWRDSQGGAGSGKVAPCAAEDSGLFWFFGPDNWEVLVKVLDGCGVNGHYWVYSAATTDVEYDLTVTDTRTSAQARYHNPPGVASPAIVDHDALAVCP